MILRPYKDYLELLFIVLVSESLDYKENFFLNTKKVKTVHTQKRVIILIFLIIFNSKIRSTIVFKYFSF